LFRVKLGASGSPAPLGRTFYSDAFYLNGSSESSRFNNCWLLRGKATLFKTEKNGQQQNCTAQNNCDDKIIQYNTMQLYLYVYCCIVENMEL
jgi:hypothetical protein